MFGEQRILKEKLQWFNRNRKWLIPVFIATSALSVVLHLGIQKSFEKTTIYKAGLQKVMSSPEVIDALGHPLKKKHAISGSITRHSDKSLSADLVFIIEGSRETAKVRLTGSQKDTACHIHSLKLRTEAGDIIKVVEHQNDSKESSVLPAHYNKETVDLSNPVMNGTKQ